MDALNIAKAMGKEDVLKKIASSGLTEYGIFQVVVADYYKQVLKERNKKKSNEPFTVIAALNNADTKGVLLEILKENPDKVLDGILIAAYVTGAVRVVLQLPEYATELADSLESKAKEVGVTIQTGLVDVRANKYNVMNHIITMAALSDIITDSYETGVYVSVNGGNCKKYRDDILVGEVLADANIDLADIKALETGYVFSSHTVIEKKISEAGVTNGVLNVVTSKDCIIQETEKRLLSSKKQGCGKCVFCREGLNQLYCMETDIRDGKGKPEYSEIIEEIGYAMTFSTQCSMGQESAKIALSSIALFEKEYEEHIKKKVCAAGICYNKSLIYIDPHICEGCEECMDVCLADCIEGKKGFIHLIDEFDCTQCGKCISACKYHAIIQTTGKPPKLPDRLLKVGKFKKH